MAEEEETARPCSRRIGAFGGMQRRGLEIPAFRSMNHFPAEDRLQLDRDFHWSRLPQDAPGAIHC